MSRSIRGRLSPSPLADGAIKWTAPIDAQVGLAAGDKLVFVASGEALHALSAADGRAVWRLPIGGDFTGPLVWNTGWLIATVASGDVVAVNAASGELVWRAKLGSPVHSTPLVDGPFVYVGTDDGRIVSLDIKTGRIAVGAQAGQPFRRARRLGESALCRFRQTLLLPLIEGWRGPMVPTDRC